MCFQKHEFFLKKSSFSFVKINILSVISFHNFNFEKVIKHLLLTQLVFNYSTESTCNFIMNIVVIMFFKVFYL